MAAAIESGEVQSELMRAMDKQPDVGDAASENKLQATLNASDSDEEIEDASEAGSPPAAEHSLFPTRSPWPEKAQVDAAMEALMTVQRRATLMGKRPFTALLLAPDNTTVLLTHQSVDHVNHAESSLARLASSHYPQAYLWQCTLFTTWEPCAMCVSTCYWANIGRIVYAASEVDLAKLTGEGNEENMTMAMPCRDVLRGSQKDVQIAGPLDHWAEMVIKQSDEYWKPIREQQNAV